MADKVMMILASYDLVHPSGKGEVQVLMNTLRGFVSGGYRVVFATSAVSSGKDSIVRDEFGDAVEIVRFPGLLGILKQLKQALSHNAANHPSLKGDNERDPRPVVSIEAGGFTDFMIVLNYVVSSVRPALRYIRKRRPDVLYGHQYMGALTAYLYSRLFGIPCVTRFMGTFVPRLLDEYGSKRKVLLRFPSWYLGLSAPADLIIMTNDGTRGQEALLSLGHPGERTRFWVNGVTARQRHIIDKGPSLLESILGEQSARDARIILSVSRLEPWKRIDRIVSAMPHIIRSCPEALLVVAGEGSDRVYLETRTRQLGVEDNVIFTGWLPHDEVLALVSSCHVVVSLYDYSNLTNQVLEALRYGKAVISLNDGTTEGVLRDGYNARLLSLNNLPDELPYAIIQILTDTRLRAKLEYNAAAYGEEYLWTWEQRMAAEVAAVDHLIENKRSK